jgi:hypothetical protein
VSGKILQFTGHSWMMLNLLKHVAKKFGVISLFDYILCYKASEQEFVVILWLCLMLIKQALHVV